MILTFSQERFEEKILEGVKTHTIRHDIKNRWKNGMKIHFWMHNPRNVSKKPHAFAIGEVSRIETIVINASNNYIKIEGVLFSSKSELTAIAINDGFRNWQEMKEFFPTKFYGKLIVFCNVKKI